MKTSFRESQRVRGISLSMKGLGLVLIEVRYNVFAINVDG